MGEARGGALPTTTRVLYAISKPWPSPSADAEFGIFLSNTRRAPESFNVSRAAALVAAKREKANAGEYGSEAATS
eukprot:CAMPEP_0119369828 /NCGR_PEP_ID=MMETSP1334-20130426/16294_1 /TAXON_ID=127549 /ORGANISM="Calcidiscus leptoporus, Strain RCC1130" /LENGTH=74 /DNA_ID=CAMNT_0007386749 /DNA_START=648 /DNA_END=872 /DNA_ORIENTATION=+